MEGHVEHASSPGNIGHVDVNNKQIVLFLYVAMNLRLNVSCNCTADTDTDACHVVSHRFLYMSTKRYYNNYVAAKATYIRLLHGKIGILEGFFGPSSVHRGRTHIVLG